MVEHVGLALPGVLYGLLITLIFIAIVWVASFVMFKLLSKLLKPPLVLMAFSVIIGALIAEITVLNDEVAFFREAESASRLRGDETFSRPRTWPHSSGSLLWAKERGVWSTD